MSDIDEIALRRLDLTLLLVFLGLMRHRKAVEVAARMGLTQSSISHSLRRLRDVFGDPLFLRKPHGLEPTAVAVALEPRVALVVQTLSAAIAGREPFDPASVRRLVTVGTYDNVMATVVPGLLHRLCHHAPGLQLVVKTVGRADAIRALDTGDIDLALGFIWSLPDTCLAEHLYDEDYLVVARTGNPVLSLEWSVSSYVAAKHIVVSPAGDLSGIVDRELGQLGLARSVVAAVPLFFPALLTVAQSDLIATLPSRIVRTYAATLGLVALRPPLEIRPFAISAFRHLRNEKSALHDWLVKEIRSVL